MKSTDYSQVQSQPDVLGMAVLHAWKTGEPAAVQLALNGVEDDPMDASWFLRSPDEFSELELHALQACRGKVLDLGAGGGCHSAFLQQEELEVTALEISEPCCEVLRNRGIQNVIRSNVMEWTPAVKYDTILLLMNGFGMGQRANQTEGFLRKLKSMLAPGGQILGEGTDVSYMSDAWKNIPRDYAGDVTFTVERNGETQSFDWVYLDAKRLELEARAAEMQCEMVYAGPTHNYLARLTADQ